MDFAFGKDELLVEREQLLAEAQSVACLHDDNGRKQAGVHGRPGVQSVRLVAAQADGAGCAAHCTYRDEAARGAVVEDFHVSPVR